MQSLLVYPTHENIDEELERYESAGLNVRAYPARTTVETERQLPNCWNEESDRAEAAGFSVGQAVCMSCSYRKQCLDRGYLAEIIAANKADVSLATHARVEYGGFQELAVGRSYVAIHEDPIQSLNPTCELQSDDLLIVQRHVQRLLSEPRFLNAFGDCQPTGDADKDKLRLLLKRRYDTTIILADLIDELVHAVETADTSTPWVPWTAETLPQTFARFLWWSSQEVRLLVHGQPWRFLLHALTGKLMDCTILVSETPRKNGEPGGKRVIKKVIGVRNNRPPPHATVWFCDATLTKERLEGILKRPVTDNTPHGHIPRQKQAFQYVRDVTRQASHRIVRALLRGILAKYPEYERVGLITHRPLLPVLQQLEHRFRKRIVMSTYYGSGQERSSNAWYQECDLILVVGTPRVPPQAIREYLVQVGQQEVACDEPPWGTLVWQGKTTTGEVKDFEGRGYNHPEWHKAHQDQVRATLVQAIGRGRSILENGCDVIVLSSEECGQEVLDEPAPMLSDAAMQVLAFIEELTPEKPIKNSIEKAGVSTPVISQTLGKSPSQTRDLLRTLESFQLIHRRGQRSGWLLTPPPIPSAETPRTESTHVDCA